MDREDRTSRPRYRRFALAFLVALPLFFGAGMGVETESADASCTYNVGTGDLASVSFSSHWSDFGGYGSWDFKAGQSQCWYEHGWDAGWFGPPDCWLNCDFWPSEIDIDSHGWIDICAYDDSGTGPQWAYLGFAANGSRAVYGQSDYGYPPGCTGSLGSAGASAAAPTRSAESVERATKRRPVSTDTALFTGRARSKNTKSITFHLRSPGGKALGSACLPPVAVTHMDLRLAQRKGVKKVYVGIVERTQKCDHPKVAGPERAGKPPADTHFAPFCQGTGGKVVRTFRYPDDFRAPNRPSCSAKAG